MVLNDVVVPMPTIGQTNQPAPRPDFEYAASWGCDPSYDKAPNELGDGDLWYQYGHGQNSVTLSFLEKFIPAVGRTIESLVKTRKHDPVLVAQDDITTMISFQLKLTQRHERLNLVRSPIAAGYIAAMFFTSENGGMIGEEGDEAGQVLASIENIAMPTIVKINQDCHKLAQRLEEWFSKGSGRTDKTWLIELYGSEQEVLEAAGRDFWYTQNHHGCGYWETDDWPVDMGNMLTAFANSYNERWLIVGDDKQLHLE